MKLLVQFVVVFCVSVIAACSQWNDESVAIEKSPSDDKAYEYLQLDNGLKVLLVSDASAEFAAASLDVFIGSGSDPKHRPGLAHFLEHMLFLGTEKYPDASEYQAFIKENAGNHNAYTSFEHTNYFFDIKAEALEPTLDRFAQFFISPTLDSAYIEREKHAVDSEYRARYKNDSRRNLDVFKTQINPQHPFVKFSVGSLESLSDTAAHKIQDDLWAFYKKWYSAENMSLVVLGKQSLPELKSMVMQKFAAVPGFSVDSTIIDEPLFNEGDLPRWLTVQPEKNLRELSLVFPVPDQSAFYQSKPMTAVGHILGHEGKGSLFSYLKDKNWAESLSAGSALNYQGGSTFALNIGLTQEGLDHQQDVVVAVFQAINRLKKDGVPAWVVDEIAQMNQLSFTYKESSAPMHYVMGLANALHYYPASKVLSAEYLMSEYRPDLINNVLAHLRLDNVLISVVADGFTNPSVSPYYQTPYAQGFVPSALLKRIQTAGLNDNIVLPSPNRLLPENLQLQVSQSSQVDKPEQLLSNERLELWYKPLDKFQLPKATSYYSFQNAQMNADIRSAVLTSLYVALLNDSLNEWVYPAQMAGLSYGLYAHGRGISLKLSGFNDKQPQLLRQLTQRILSAEFTESQFMRVKSELQRRLMNAEKLPPYQKLMANWQVQMNYKKWHASDQLLQLNDLQLEDVRNWSASLWNSAYIKAMTNGNISRDVALQMLQGLQKAIDNQSAVKGQPSLELAKLPLQSFYSQVASQHADAGYLLYWQAKDNTVEDQAQWLLLGKTLEAAYFDQLRTQQQLGYIVFAHYYPQLTVPGLTFIVQSPKASVEQIHAATLAFIAEAEKSTAAMPEQLFVQYKEALVQKLLEAPKKLTQESDGYWYDLALGDLTFTRRQQLAEAINQLTLIHWKAAVASVYADFPKRSYLLGTAAFEDFGESFKFMTPIELDERVKNSTKYIYR